ncbi:nitroreductase family deazaflavin-dependent oxidoreductase [Actinoplanes sp. Pm04-4]|uniref:Nitroreductase family deazaflavin-dependent oxidoreductase n=1 Tax=Paractinoplanes pyxinae TaxID=2997416 RepID=A0ABT4BD81_9ACTN|nr:nitroreductase family deazaflavin-dependent oxidoreductase [Actinoplanes pyxinae]MCY1144421.1 nitroreductase family deazaflavin-dependent oxidoreductase [Actinoplanes pyxinae]
MPNPFNQQIIDEFRANKGRVGGPFAGSTLILLTTRGARSGRPHTTPLGPLPDGDRLLVIASAAGAPHHPDWFHNIRTNPQVTVETGAETYEATAIPLTGEDRDKAFARAAADDPGWSDYQSKTTRTIPVVALVRVSAD